MPRRRVGKPNTRSEFNEMVRQRQQAELRPVEEVAAETAEPTPVTETAAVVENVEPEAIPQEFIEEVSLVLEMKALSLADDKVHLCKKSFDINVEGVMKTVGNILAEGVKNLEKDEAIKASEEMQKEVEEIIASWRRYTEAMGKFIQLFIQYYPSMNCDDARISEEAVDEMQEIKNNLIAMLAYIIEKKVVEKVAKCEEEFERTPEVLKKEIAVKAANEIERAGSMMAKGIYLPIKDKMMDIVSVVVVAHDGPCSSCCREHRKEQNIYSKYKIPEHYNQELKDGLVEMYKKEEKNHKKVYPDLPISRNPYIIPTGQMLRCVCSPDCPYELAEPEYRDASKEEVAIIIGVQEKMMKNARKVKK